MKKGLLPFLSSIFLLASCQSQSTSPKMTKPVDSSKGFAVIELFTSQGCSSCPPADELLGKEIAAAQKAGTKLIALSFHVDYWNRLGWTDPFSQHQFSQRQYGYSAKMKGDGVYTPQAIVNGQTEAVGGNKTKIESLIREGLAKKPEATLNIISVEKTGNQLKIAYQYTGPIADLHIAVVEKQVSTPIKAGENGGRTLTNFNVVKSWKYVPAESGSYSLETEMPAGYNSSDYTVVLYAQEKDYGKILAADVK